MKKVNYSSAGVIEVTEENPDIFVSEKNAYLRSVLLINNSSVDFTVNVVLFMEEGNKKVPLFNRFPLPSYRTEELLKDSDLFIKAGDVLSVENLTPEVPLSVYLSFGVLDEDL